MTEPTAVPPEWLTGLSTRARNALINLKVQSRQDLIALSKLKLPRVRGCGTTTKKELKLLLERVRLEPAEPPFPSDSCSPSGCDEGAVAVGNRPEASSGIPIAGPARWSILNKTAAELFAVNASPSFQESAGTLRLPLVDLVRLRARGIFPEDTAHLLCSFTIGYLLETGLSDQAMSALLHVVARLSGLPGDALPTPAVAPADYSLYAGFPEGVLDPLIVPDFAFPALLDPADDAAETVAWSVVAKITEHDVFRKFGCTITALRALRHLWHLQQWAATIAESAAAGIPTDSYLDIDTLPDRYLQLAVTRKSRHTPPQKQMDLYRSLLWGRPDLQYSDRVTLSTIGEKFGFSKQRVQQVEIALSAKLTKEENLRHLDFLWHLLDRLMALGGGGRYVHELCLSLQNMLGLSYPPSEEAIALLVRLSPRYRVVWDPPQIRMALTATSCVGCETGSSAVLDAVAASEHGTLSFQQALDIMRGACEKGGCPALHKAASFSPSLVHFIADSNPQLSVHNQTLHQELPASRSSIREELEKIILSQPEGMHYEEIHRRLKLALPEASSSPATVYKRLGVEKWAVLWGLGIFKHRDLLTVPVSLICEIQKEIASALDQRDVPYLCAGGQFYDKYADRLRAHGVPTSRAFYSCMKIVGSPTMIFDEFPYVTRKHGADPRPPLHYLLEQFIANANRAISYEEARGFLAGSLGASRAQMSHPLSHVQNTLKVGELLLHIDSVPAVTDQLRSIVDEPPSRKEGTGPLKVRLLRKHQEACKAIGITRANDLVCFVERFLPGRFDWQLRHKRENQSGAKREPNQETSGGASVTEVPQRRTAPPANWVLSYLEDLAKPCRPKDIFVAFRAHPQQAYLYQRWLGNAETVLWYTRDTVIARKILEWNDDKQYAIEALALMHLEPHHGPCRRYGSCSEIFRDMQGELPDLPQGPAWTPVLLHSLLVSGSNFLKIGRQKDFFVAKDNTCGIATLDDLLYHALMTDYGGVVSKKALIAAYAKLGITLLPTRPFLVGKDERVVVDGDVIRAAGSVPAKSMTTEDTEVHGGTQRNSKGKARRKGRSKRS